MGAVVPDLLLYMGAVSALDLQTQDPAEQMEIARRYQWSVGGVPGVANNFAEAMKWYRRSADQGYTPAMKAIGDINYQGLGRKRDVSEAEKWYRRAAERGDADAMVSLGQLLSAEDPMFGRRNESEAVRWYGKAAEQGHPLGMTHLAMALQSGRGVAVDKAAALEWFRRAAEKGNAVSASMVKTVDACLKAGRPLSICL